MAERRRARNPLADLTRRERQIMDVIYGLGRASAADVHARLPDAPAPTAVRTLLRILEDKGHLRHEKSGVRHIYLPTVPREAARESSLRDLIRTFFAGSTAAAVAAMIDVGDRDMTDAERDDLVRRIRGARARGR